VAQHILRKDLKRDEFRERFAQGVESVSSHQQLAWVVIGAALVVVLAVLGWNAYTKRQTAKAGVALQDAMKVYDARVRTANEPADPGEITYVDEKNKFTDAERSFLNVANQYGRTRPGQIARYYAALSDEHLKRFDEAEKNLKMLESGSDVDMAGLARFQLAGVYDENGKGPQAVELYKQLADKPTIFVPKGLALITLADHYSKTDPAEATKLYNQIKKDFPDSPVAEEADQKLQLLNAKS
jgi:predicted negative regulator of RcsB-dependent stress response